jgi:hypothetical protein
VPKEFHDIVVEVHDEYEEGVAKLGFQILTRHISVECKEEFWSFLEVALRRAVGRRGHRASGGSSKVSLGPIILLYDSDNMFRLQSQNLRNLKLL